MIDAVRVRVPAKVNLFLAVRGRRADGYHDIVSVMHTVGLYDTVIARLEGPERSRQHPAARRLHAVSLSHDAGPRVPAGEENLATHAARCLAEHLGAPRIHRSPRCATTRLVLEKRIPVAAGMAGGSADAAATLIALNRLWGSQLSRDDLREIAADLGADVPFCVVGGTALATGTGVATAQVLCRGTYHWVVGVADEPLSTADVYRVWDEEAEPSQVEPDAVLAALRTRDAEALGAALHNDLQPAADRLRPGLAAARRAMLDAGALGAVVSGSGPTLVALATDADDARRIAGEVADLFARTEVVTSPAGGPEPT